LGKRSGLDTFERMRKGRERDVSFLWGRKRKEKGRNPNSNDERGKGVNIRTRERGDGSADF